MGSSEACVCQKHGDCREIWCDCGCHHALIDEHHAGKHEGAKVERCQECDAAAKPFLRAPASVSNLDVEKAYAALIEVLGSVGAILGDGIHGARVLQAAPCLDPPDAARLQMAVMVVQSVNSLLTDTSLPWSNALKVREAARVCIEALCEKAEAT